MILLCDTSPQAMILPTGIFDFLQESQDFYLPPLTGSYLRFVRFLTFLLSLVLTPLWYLFVACPWLLPASLSFIVPTEAGHFPILLQLFLVEFAVDGLKLASMNTPDLLANSMSVVGGLVLGDLAVKVGWLSGEVIFYMAIVAVAGFTQQNHELGYAMKFLRATTVSIYTNIQPVVASFVAISIGQDIFTWDKPLAGFLVLLGAYILVNLLFFAYEYRRSPIEMLRIEG